MTGSAWTDERAERLRVMWVAGKSAGDIATAMGISRNAVIGKVHRLKLAARPSPIKYRRVTAEADVVCEDVPADKGPAPRTCRFLSGEALEYNYCAAPVVAAGSWCEKHFRLVFEPSRRKQRGRHQ